MSLTELLHQAKSIKLVLSSDFKICLGRETITLCNPSITLTWSTEGYLTEVRLTGTTPDGETKTYRKTLTWSPEGLLQQVSPWEEV